MHSDNVITLKLGNKLIFKHPISQLNKLGNKKQINQNINYINNDVIPLFMLDINKTNEEYEKRFINEERLLRKMMKGFFPWGKNNYINEISKEEEQINNLEKLIQKNKLNDDNKLKDIIGVLNQENDNKKEILNKISNNKKKFSEILGLNKNNIALINGHLSFIKEKVAKEADKENNNNNNYINNRNKTEPNKNSYKKINIIKEEYIEAFKNFIGNSKLSNRIIISYFDINHPNIKIAAQKYFKSKYGTDEITLIYIYKKSSETFYHKFKYISEINELFIKAKKENYENPKLFLKSGKEIKNNRKIKCVGALNLNNNTIINIM